MEAWGRGVPLILENAPDTRFTEIGGLFITRFERPSTQEMVPTPETSIENTKTSTKTSIDTSIETGRELPKNTRAVLLQYLREQPQASIPDLVQATGLKTTAGLSASGVRHHLD